MEEHEKEDLKIHTQVEFTKAWIIALSSQGHSTGYATIEAHRLGKEQADLFMKDRK